MAGGVEKVAWTLVQPAADFGLKPRLLFRFDHALTASAEEVGERGREVGELEAKAVVESGGGEDAFAVEEFVGEAAERGAEKKCGDAEEGGTAEGVGEGVGEVGVACGPRRGAVERAAEVEVFDGEEGELGEVVEVNPGHPLAAVAERAAEAEFENGGHRRERAAVFAEDEGGAEQDGADAFGALRFGFPRLYGFGEEAATGGRGFKEFLVAVIAVETNG